MWAPVSGPASTLEKWLPGLRAARTYQRDWVRPDVVAGLVLAAILVPQGMAYAELAGVPPVNGLYATIGCLVGYAVFGPSRVLVLGPDSSVSPLILAAIAPLAVSGDTTTTIELAALLGLMVGFIEIALGLFRFGFVADLLSSEVQVGYMNGLAVTIIVGQLPKLFGFSTDASSFGGEVAAFFRGLDQTEAAALTIGIVVLVILFVLPRVAPRVPAVLVAVAVATIASAVFGLADQIATVGHLPRGFPKPAIPWTSRDDLWPLLVAAVGITLVSLTDTIATSASFAARRGEEVDPDQEMVGIGAANLASGLLQGFAVSTSGSRTAVAEQSGARTQLSSVVGAGIVVLLILFFNGLLADLPQSALGAIVIVAATSLINVKALLRYAAVRPSALVLSLTASIAVIVLGVLEGIAVAIVFAVLLFFKRNWWPHGTVIGRVDGLDGWHSLEDYPAAREVPGVVLYRWEAPLFFANAGAFRRQVRHLAREREPDWVVIQCEAITDIDVTAAGIIDQLDRELNAQGVHMAFVEMRAWLQDLVERYGLLETLDRDHFYPSMRSAIAAIQAERE
jgi:high affinity sulfate transporter 1